jgi:hypothetical protein
MMDQPTIRELVEAVRSFLETKAMPELKGHTAFHARVAVNALAIVARQLELGAKAEAEETARLVGLIGHGGELDELNRDLCARIRSGGFALDDARLTAHLEATTRDKVAIDQPGYSGLKIAQLRRHNT